VTKFAATKDNPIKIEKSEPNSMREVSLFCAVLIVEIYSLAVSFGGPFFEVGYFLLVVVSQTFAGAYIWANLRQSDKTLPLPELLAMGFAIGSASAAISQLIIRDLFGIRLFLSPLIPMIGVAIWLLTKRDRQLPVTITHATTNSLLWLLFPAPLAISYFQWELNLIFTIPLFLIIVVLKSTKATNQYLLLLVVTALSVVFGLLIRIALPFSVALGLVGPDEIMDEGFAIGFSNWGIDEHIGRSGDSFAYYKLSHCWLGPLLELIGASPIIISTSVMPITVFVFVGLSLWSLSQKVFKNSRAANLAAVLFFIGSSLPEPDNLAIRVAQCLVIVYLLTGLIALLSTWSCIFQESLVVALIFFVLLSTRSQFGVIVLSGYLLHRSILLLRRKLTLRHYVSTAAAVVSSLVSSFLIFLNEPAHAVGAPNQSSKFALVGFLLSFVGVRSIIPLLAIKRDKNYQLSFLIAIVVSSVIIFFFIPLSILANSPSLTIALLASILISNDISKLQESLTRKLFVSIFILSSGLGFLLRLFYDMYKWIDSANIRAFVKPFVKLATEGKYLAIFATIPFATLIALLLLLFRITHKRFSWRPILLLTASSMSFGISFATSFRAVTSHLRYQTELAGEITTDSPMSWYENSDRLAALEWLRTNTLRDDIFAQNTSTPDFSSTAYAGSLIISSSVHRRAYIEGVNSTELQRDYPRNVFHQTERQRKELLRLNTSFRFPITPSNFDLANMHKENVKWFVVDLTNTTLRDWEPWATTRFMNEKVAILELAQAPVPSN